MVIDVKPATTLAEAADQMEEARGMCVDHYIPVCDVVLARWSAVCRSVDVDALLRIAQVLESADKSEYRGCILEDSGCHLCIVGVEHEIAERIREAVGR